LNIPHFELLLATHERREERRIFFRAPFESLDRRAVT
jgi:hypothetical protein